MAQPVSLAPHGLPVYHPALLQPTPPSSRSQGPLFPEELTQQEKLVAIALPQTVEQLRQLVSCAPAARNATEGDKVEEEPQRPPRSTSPATYALDDILAHINDAKVQERKVLRTPPSVMGADNVCLVGEKSGKIKWIQPSGPRRSGEGIEEEEQGILSAEQTSSGGAMLRVTLLASGFIIGPSGSTVREICKQTGADIKSWTEPSSAQNNHRPARTFVIEGRRRSLVLALSIICDAIDRYKELCEGGFCGQYVPRLQSVRGIDFCYQPPPRNVVPYAAALQGPNSRERERGRPPGSPVERRRSSSEDHEYATRILIDVQNRLQHHLAAAGELSGDEEAYGHRRHHDPVYEELRRYNQYLAQRPPTGRRQDRRYTEENVPIARASSGSMAGIQIPEGHVLLSPNVIVPMEALKQGWLLNCAQGKDTSRVGSPAGNLWEGSQSASQPHLRSRHASAECLNEAAFLRTVQEMSLAGRAGNKYSSAPDASTYQEALDQLQAINTSSLFSNSYAPLTEPLRPYSTQEAFMPELPLPRHAFEQQRPVPYDLPSMDTQPDFGTMARHPPQEMQFDPVWQGGSVDLPDSLPTVTMPPPTLVTAPWIRGAHPFWEDRV